MMKVQGVELRQRQYTRPHRREDTSLVLGMSVRSGTHRAVCTCGWRGPPRFSDAEARADAELHAGLPGSRFPR